MSIDPYEELGVARDANADEIKAAHRKAVRKHHPDAGGEPEKFGAIQCAYEVLSDSRRRERFDRTGSTQAGASVSKLEAQAMEVVSMMILGAVNGDVDLDHSDIRQAILANLAQADMSLGEQRAEKRQALTRLDKLERRFKKAKRRRGKAPDTDGVGMIGRAVAQHRRILSEALDKVEEMIQVQGIVRAVFEAVDYDFDAMPPASPYGEPRPFLYQAMRDLMR